MRTPTLIWILLLLVLTGCGTPAGPAQVQQTETTAPLPSSTAVATLDVPEVDVATVEAPTATVPPTPYETGIPVPPAAVEAQKALAERLRISADAVKITRIEEKKWPDGCLGAGRPDEICSQAIVDGFLVQLEADGVLYEYHTNQNGSLLRQADPAGPKGEVIVPEAVQKAQALLGQQLGINASQVGIIQFEQVDWPDACLGIEETGTICAAVITPGYDIIFQAGGKRYNFHTDLGGGRIVEAPVLLNIEGSVLDAAFEEDGACQRVVIDVEGLKTGPCDGDLQRTPLRSDWMKDLSHFLTVYASFSEEISQGKISFQGEGEKEATVEQQRSLLEWARLRLLEVQGSQMPDDHPGIVFRWQREGGFAGFCDALTVYRDGSAMAENCRSQPANRQQTFWLEEKQLVELYEWLDQSTPFAYHQEDAPGAADSMSITLTFTGDGSQMPTDAEQAVFALFAQDVYTGVSQ